MELLTKKRMWLCVIYSYERHLHLRFDPIKLKITCFSHSKFELMGDILGTIYRNINKNQTNIQWTHVLLANVTPCGWLTLLLFFCFINRWINYWCWRKPVHSTQQSAHRFATSSPHHKSSLLLFRYVLVSHRTRWCAYSCDAYVLVCVLILSVCCTWAVLVLCIVEPI